MTKRDDGERGREVLKRHCGWHRKSRANCSPKKTNRRQKIISTYAISGAIPRYVLHEDADFTQLFGTKKQVADRYHVSKRTVDNWIRAKRIPVLHIGGSVRFDLARVDEALRRFEVKEIA